MQKKYFILFVAAAYFLSGCKAIELAKQKRQEKKAKYFFYEHPDKAAAFCAEKFPARDSLRIDSTEATDTLYLESQGDPVAGDCPPAKIIRTTKTVTKDVVRVDSAAAHALRLALEKTQERAWDFERQYLKESGKASTRLWMFIAACVGVGSMLLLTIKKLAWPALKSPLK